MKSRAWCISFHKMKHRCHNYSDFNKGFSGCPISAIFKATKCVDYYSGHGYHKRGIVCLNRAVGSTDTGREIHYIHTFDKIDVHGTQSNPIMEDTSTLHVNH